MKQERMKIGPSLAAEFLGKNGANRPEHRAATARYVRDMQEGRWRYNPTAPIAIDENGGVLDGAHRLRAIITSATTQEFDVLFNVPRDLFPYIDTGERRSGADTLGVLGELSAKNLAAALSWVVNEERARAIAVEGAAYRITQRWAITNDAIRDALERHPGIRDSMWVYNRLSPRRLAPASISVWTHYRFARVDKERADAYWLAVATGEVIGEGDPEFAVRKWLLKALAAPRKPNKEMTAAIIIKGWNKAYRGQKMMLGQWDANKEGFPYVEGE